jgi:transcriptional regulator with XRE-family HTH domain
MMDNSYIATRVKETRLEKQLTLKQLADRTGLSRSYLSQIENDRCSPSLATLKKIARALAVRTVDFFADELLDDPVVISRDQWTKVTLPGWEADVRQIVRTVSNKRMQPFLTEIEPGGRSRDPYSHIGEEFGLVLEGELTLTVGDRTYKVSEGLAFYHSSLLAHSWENKGKRKVRVVWVVTPPSW